MMLLQPRDVARRLGFSVNHVRKLMRTDQLPHFDVGNRHYMTEGMLDDFINGGWAEPPDEGDDDRPPP